MSNKRSEFSGLSNILSSMSVVSRSLATNFHYDKLASSLDSIQQQLIQTFEAIIQSSLVSQEMLSDISNSLNNIAQPLFSNLQKQFDSLISPAFDKLFESIQSLPDQLKTALLILGNNGWFFDLDLPLPFLWEIEKKLIEGEIEAAESELVNYYREHLSSIQENITNRFPYRKRIIDLAFDAHNRGEYELAIPVLLAQSDGICFDVINSYMFIRSRKDNKPMTSLYVDSITSNMFRQALLSPLTQPLPISLTWNERGDDFTQLNRHQVMHGEALDYGSEINSLKSISLLNYLAQTLPLDEDTKT